MICKDIHTDVLNISWCVKIFKQNCEDILNTLWLTKILEDVLADTVVLWWWLRISLRVSSRIPQHVKTFTDTFEDIFKYIMHMQIYLITFKDIFKDTIADKFHIWGDVSKIFMGILKKPLIVSDIEKPSKGNPYYFTIFKDLCIYPWGYLNHSMIF